VALGMQHAMSVSLVVCKLSDSTIIFFNFTHKQHGFRKVSEYKMCVLILCTILSEIHLILRGAKRDIIISIHRSSCKVPIIPLRF